jgi:hypothetical protein
MLKRVYVDGLKTYGILMSEGSSMTLSATQVDPKATVLGLFYNKEGVLCQRMKQEDGTIKIVPVPGGPAVDKEPASAKEFIEDEGLTDKFNARFNDTETIPHDLAPVSTSPLVSKAVAKEMAALTEIFKKNGTEPDGVQKLLIQWMDVIFAEHALLIRVVGSPESLAERKEPLDVKNSALHEYIQLQIDIIKGPWLDVRHKIKSSK